MKTQKFRCLSFFILIFAPLVGCDKWNGAEDVVVEIAVTDVMVNTMPLVARFADKPEQLVKVYRAIAQDWVNAEKAPERSSGNTEVYDFKRIDLTKKTIVECIGDDGYQLYERSRRLHSFLGGEIERQFASNVVDPTALRQILSESISIAKKNARASVPAEQKWLANAELIALCLENLDRDLAQSSKIAQIDGAREAIHNLLTEQIMAIAENGALVNTLLGEMRAVFRDGKVNLNDHDDGR